MQLFNKRLFLIFVYTAVAGALFFMVPVYLLVIYGNDNMMDLMLSGIVPKLMNVAMLYMVFAFVYGIGFISFGEKQ